MHNFKSFTILKLLSHYEKLMVKVLVVMMVIAITLGTLDLGLGLYKSILAAPRLLLNTEQLIDVFSLIMLIIIGIELLESIIKTYLFKGKAHFEVVLSVAIIAIARKVIILDLKAIDSLSMIGIAAIILSLTIGYYFMKRSEADTKSDPTHRNTKRS